MGEKRTLVMPTEIKAQWEEVFTRLKLTEPDMLLTYSLEDLLAEMFWAGFNRGSSQRAREERLKERALARVSSPTGEYVRVESGSVMVAGYEVGHYSPEEQVEAIPYTRVTKP